MSADALVSVVLEQLVSIIVQETQQEVRLVVGVRKEVQKLTSTLRTIGAVLVDAEKRQVTEEVVRVWLEKLKDISYDMDDVLDEWNTAILRQQIAPIPKKKVFSFIPSPCFCFNRVVLRRDIAHKIKELNERLEVIAIEKEKFKFDLITGTEEPERLKTTSFVDVSEVHGRALDKNNIISKLLGESSQEEAGLHIISIVGMGGIGKTTLAQLAYNDDEVKAHFQKRAWVCVSDPFDEIRIAKAIVEALEGNAPNSNELESLLQRIGESIVGKKCLLVLDDVWTEDYRKWEQLKHSLKCATAQGSRVLVTTRSERVAKMMGTTYRDLCHLEKLSEEECWLLFSQIAFFGKDGEGSEKLQEIGRKIANKCKGLPLAAKTLGSLLRFKETEQDWENVLNSETWEIEEVERGLIPPLLLSYYDLSAPVKRCFSYCSIFPKDYEIDRDNLIKLWMSQGFLSSKGSIDMETKGEEYFDNLVMRSFFQDFERDENDGSIIGCKMHDIVHDFAQFLMKNECFIMEIDSERELQMESSCIKARHATITILDYGISNPFPPPFFYDVKNLRTLQILLKHGNRFLPFDHLTCLRALHISGHIGRELPGEIGKLVHLRYLDLPRIRFLRELPETVCDLYNLQTLNLNDCSSLRKLPQGISKLINLRHLQIEGTRCLISMPHEIGRMSSLRTLSKLIISEDNNEEGCKLGDLKNLDLKGSLSITRLDNVTNVGDAIEVKLIEKHLSGLELEFSVDEGIKDVMENVIEALRPHPDLKELTISVYGGTMFPNWMSLLPNLRYLELDRCYCEHLPPNLGKLPSLVELHIDRMQNVKRVGVEFLGLGIINNDEDRTSKKDGTAPLIVFPKLKVLHFFQLEEWEEWAGPTRKRQEDDGIKIMPSLLSLDILDCPKLKALPYFLKKKIPLRKVKISESDQLEVKITGSDQLRRRRRRY